MTVSCGGPITALDLRWCESRPITFAPDWPKTVPVFQTRLMTEQKGKKAEEKEKDR